jgi:hypothetical protein
VIVTRITLAFGALVFGLVCWLAISGVGWAIEMVITILALVALIAFGSNVFPPMRALPKFRRRSGEQTADHPEAQDLEA